MKVWDQMLRWECLYRQAKTKINVVRFCFVHKSMIKRRLITLWNAKCEHITDFSY